MKTKIIWEIMALAKELYGSEVQFMTGRHTDLGNSSPMTYVLSGEAEKVLNFLKEKKARDSNHQK